MATINSVITRVDAVKMNTYTAEEKARWLIELEGRIFREILRSFGEYPVSEYPEDGERELIAPSPYDTVYDYYLFAMIDFHNRETENYNNSIDAFNQRYDDFAKEWHRTHCAGHGGSLNTMGAFAGGDAHGDLPEKDITELIEMHNAEQAAHPYILELIAKRYTALCELIENYRQLSEGVATDSDISDAVAEHQNSIFAHAELFEELKAGYAELLSAHDENDYAHYETFRKYEDKLKAIAAEVLASLDEHNADADAHGIGEKINELEEKIRSTLEGYATTSQVNAFYRYWTKHDAATNPHGITPSMIGAYTTDETDELLRKLIITGGSGNGAILISVHDELYKEIIPEDGQMFIVKYHDMPYGEDPSLISPEVFYRLRIGDGVTPLCDIPNFSNIVAGTGNGSAILADPTYDNGDDGLDAPKNIADAQYAVAFGKYLKNYGKASALFGYSNENHAARAFMAGMSNLATAEAIRAFVSGYKQTAKAQGAGLYGGGYNTVEARDGTILGGQFNKLFANAHRAILSGQNLISQTPDQVVLGHYNEIDGDAILIIGAGTSEEDRRNALCIYKDGSAKIDGGLISGKVLEALCGIKNAAVPGTIAVDVYGNVTVNPSAGEETTQSYLMTQKKYGGYSDVTSTALSEYTEYPAEGSGSERKWAWLGTVASKSYSNGNYAATGQRIIITIQEPDEWAAFKIKVDEDGEYALIGDTVHYSGSGRYEAYLLPMTDAIAAELAPDNAETYGELVSAEDGTDRVARINYKLFSELTSVAGAAPIGEAVNTNDKNYTEATTFNDKFGAVNIKAGEYVLILRAAEGSNYNNMMFRNFHLKKFEPLTDAIKVGDTVLTEEEVLEIKASAGTADFSGLVTDEELEAAIGGITPAGIGAATSGHSHDDRYYTEAEVDTKLAGKAAASHTHTASEVGAVSESEVTEMIAEAVGGGTTATFKYGTAAPTTLGEGEVFFVYEE